MTANMPVKFYLYSKCQVNSNIEESYINKEPEKQLRSRYDHFISSVPICCCGIESVRSTVVSFESSFDRNQRLVHREK